MVSLLRKIKYLLRYFPQEKLLFSTQTRLERLHLAGSKSILTNPYQDISHLTMNCSSSLSILNSHYCTVVNDLISSYSSESSPNPYLQKVFSHFQTVLDYNVVDGKKLRGTTVIDTVRALSSSSTTGDLSLKHAAILGWCIELMQAGFLVADDIMDHSLTRRGKPCWYLQARDKDSAINDTFYLYSCTFTLLNRYFPTNVKLYHLFNEIFQRTVIGQGLDLQTSSHLPSIDLYTDEHYFTVVTWKTAYYTILLPIMAGLLITSSSSLVDHPELRLILLNIGTYFQVQDDYLDCYGNVSRTGKIGTDIQEHKCSWLIVQAMKILSTNEVKRKILRANYGFDDLIKVQIVKDIYKEINLEQVYQDYEQTTYENIFKRIEKAQFHSKELEKLLKQILDSIHSRSK